MRGEQPFHVKRTRLKTSILKTYQILQHLSSSQNRLASPPHTQPTSLMAQQLDLLNNRTNQISLAQMRELIKQHRTHKEQGRYGMGTGLEGRKIRSDNQKSLIKQSSGKHSRLMGDKKERFFTLREGASCSRLGRLISQTSISPFINDKSQAESTESDPLAEKCSSPLRKNKLYLYEKMANSGKQAKGQSNQVYEKRIRSYMEFLWKLQLAHNVHSPLDLALPPQSIKKLKAFVGPGNNSNMVKGLIKRRFWWVISEQFTEDCSFVWTQIKINRIFQRQESAQQPTCSNLLNLAQLVNMPKFKHKNTHKSLKKAQRQKILDNYNYNRKIWSQVDSDLLQYFILKFITKQDDESQSLYANRCKQINEKCKTLRLANARIEKAFSYYSVQPILHNHLQNNFYLGNKKALFYNLRDYCHKIGQNLFTRVPLTFHIKRGFRDPEYRKFLLHFKKRAKEIGEEQEQGKNIWIVKPGENSNQGSGIQVIDEIYELNNIIKKSEGHKKATPTTWIVQLYLDRPLLYNERKFDLRHYVLLTQLHGILRAYWYEEGYVRTTAYPFSINNFASHIHLTNDAIQKHTLQYGKYEPYNKLSYADLHSYMIGLQNRVDFKGQVLPKMKELATQAVKSVSGRIGPKLQMHNFQILGLDFMLDRSGKPWLIEVNTNPCLDCSCPLLDRIIPYMLEQAFKLSIDIIYPPPYHYPHSAQHLAPFISLQNFKYQMIYDSLSDGVMLGEAEMKGFEEEEDQEFKDDGRQIKLEDFT